jgi:hypothetical protein
MDIKLPFGLKNNKIVHIDDIPDEGGGKRCGCVCPNPECRSPLIAVRGPKRQHHFRHDADCECKGGLESAIHIAAKQVISERKHIKLPQNELTIVAKDSRGKEHKETETFVKEGTLMSFDSVQEEKGLHGIKADILAKKDDTQFIIEVCYSHKVDDQKRAKIAEAKISAIEIDLSDLTVEDVKDMETFSACVIGDPRRIQWLYNAEMYQKLEELEKKLKEKLYEQEKVYAQDKIKNINHRPVTNYPPRRPIRQNVISSGQYRSLKSINKGNVRF